MKSITQIEMEKIVMKMMQNKTFSIYLFMKKANIILSRSQHSAPMKYFIILFNCIVAKSRTN